MGTKETALADPKPTTAKPGKPKALTVEGVKLTRIRKSDDEPQHPVARYKGEAPSVGDTLTFTLENDVTYSGKVSDATEADGEVLAEFKDGLTPVPTK